jgi:hypothetical protein
MGLPTIGFFTPVKYRNQPANWIEQAREMVDECFRLKGRVAVITDQSVKFEDRPIIWWQSVLKVAAFITGPMSLAVLAHFPAAKTIRGLNQLSIALTLLPLALIAARIVLRTTLKLHPVTNLPVVIIPAPVKRVLDRLLGGEGAVDKLPIYPHIGGENPLAKHVKFPIMKGIEQDSEGNTYPILVIKVRCLEPEKLVKRTDVPVSLAVGEGIVCLGQYRSDQPLRWQESSGSFGPQFFTINVTYSASGELVESQKENFQRLQTFIKIGRGTDLRGIEWEIVQQSDSAEKSKLA